MKIQRLLAPLFAAALLAALAGCGAPGNGEQAPLDQQHQQAQQEGGSGASLPDTDRSGNPIALSQAADAVISMAPSITQTILDLGMGDKLVAVDDYSAMYFGLEELPTFDMMEPDTEQMAILDADLVFTSGMSASAGADPFQPLRDIGVCVADIPSAENLEAMFEDTRFIAACIGAEDLCETLIAQAQAEIDALAAIGGAITEKKRVLVEIASAPDIYTAGDGTFMQEMLTVIGAENIFGDQAGYLSVTEEAAVSLNPDVILTMVDYVDDPAGEILSRAGWENVTAVVNGDVYPVNTNAVSLPNLHVVDGMKQMAKLIYPEAYAGVDDPFAQDSAA